MILVLCELKDGTIRKPSLEALSEARRLADAAGTTVGALFLGASVSGCEQAAAYGADAVLTAEAPTLASTSSDAYAAVLADAVKAKGASILLGAATALGKDVLPRAAARLGAGYAADVTALSMEGGRLQALRPAPAATATARPAQTLEDLDLGDPTVTSAVRRARRIVGLDIPLLIQGETGTGKEVFAQAFHHSSPRRDGPFVAINCAAIPANLIEAELFGYRAGAYTGARGEGARGKLREAHGGTLFLDEIGDMPLRLQAVLLRVLETRRVAPLGGGPEEAIDLALVCASHRPLKTLCETGEFRPDLYFRLSAMSLALPALRERTDIEALARRILRDESPNRPLRLAAATLDVIRRHPWPGNIRELKNVLRLATAMLGPDEATITPAHLPHDLTDSREARPTTHSLRAAETRLVEETVARHAGNISAAARELGITRTTLYRKLRRT